MSATVARRRGPGLGLVAALVAVAAAGCRERAAPVAPPAGEDLARGRGVVAELKQQLVGRLTAELASGIPGAIAVCNTEAPAIAAGLSVDGVEVGRATRKPRNPANRAAGWTAEALTRFEKMVTDGRDLAGASFSRRLPDGRTAYAEPLVVQPMCLACHGAQLAPDVTAALAERYPQDEATGYQAGDLRGLVWVELPAAP